MKVLHLTLVKVWFDMTDSGEKPEEYREITPYWIKRLFKHPEIFNVLNNGCVDCKFRKDVDNMPACSFDGIKKFSCDIGKFEWPETYFKHFDAVFARNGYNPKKNPSWLRKFVGISIGYGQDKWGAEPGKQYFVIKLGERIN